MVNLQRLMNLPKLMYDGNDEILDVMRTNKVNCIALWNDSLWMTMVLCRKI